MSKVLVVANLGDAVAHDAEDVSKISNGTVLSSKDGSRIYQKVQDPSIILGT